VPALADVLVDPATQWQTLTIPFWYGEQNRQVEVASATAVWYHSGMPVIPPSLGLDSRSDGIIRNPGLAMHRPACHAGFYSRLFRLSLADGSRLRGGTRSPNWPRCLNSSWPAVASTCTSTFNKLSISRVGQFMGNVNLMTMESEGCSRFFCTASAECERYATDFIGDSHSYRAEFKYLRQTFQDFYRSRQFF